MNAVMAPSTTCFSASVSRLWGQGVHVQVGVAKRTLQAGVSLAFRYGICKKPIQSRAPIWAVTSPGVPNNLSYHHAAWPKGIQFQQGVRPPLKTGDFQPPAII